MTRLLEWEDAVHARFLAAKFLRERLSVGVCGVENKREQTRLPGGLPAREIKKTRGPGFYRGRTRRRDRTGARRHQHPKPAPQAGAIHGAAAGAAGAAPSLAGPNSERLWTACFQPPRGGRVAGRVPNTRSEACTYILLWFIAEGPLGALSHDSDSDEPQPLL